MNRKSFDSALALAAAHGHMWAGSVQAALDYDNATTRATRLGEGPDEDADRAQELLDSYTDGERRALERVAHWVTSTDPRMPDDIEADIGVIDDAVDIGGPAGIPFDLEHVTGSGRSRWSIDPREGVAFIGTCRPSRAWRRWRELQDAAEQAGPLARPAIVAVAGEEPDRGNEVVIFAARFPSGQSEMRFVLPRLAWPLWAPRGSRGGDVVAEGEVWRLDIPCPESVEARHVHAFMRMADALLGDTAQRRADAAVGDTDTRDRLLAALAEVCPAAIEEWKTACAEAAETAGGAP